MLVVTVESHSGDKPRVIGRAEITNTGGDIESAGYSASVSDDRGSTKYVTIPMFTRKRGAWALLKAVLEKL